MTDQYTKLVNGPLKGIVKRLGLPAPARLRRFDSDGAYLSQPVLVLGRSEGAEAYSSLLLDEGFEVRRSATSEKLSAIVVCYDEATHPDELSAVALELGGALRSLTSGGRVVLLSRDAHIVPEQPADMDPALNAVRSGVIGMMRSLAHEMRGGSTANSIVVSDGVRIDAPSARAALWFLLSSKSAYVAGQPIYVTSDRGAEISSAEFAQVHGDGPLTGRTAVVTGAARGIGRAIAETLARDGAKVFGVDMPQAGEALAETANRVGGRAIHADVTSPDAAAHIAASVGAPIDILINNAGITRDKLLANMDAGRWDSVIAVNIASQLRMNAALTEAGSWGEAPRIVSLASIAGIAGNRGQTNYGASKAGVIGLTAASAAPFSAQTGGTINAVAPGFIETDMTKAIPVLTREFGRRLSSLQQGGLPVDVAETISFLSSDAAGGITGSTLRVCGQSMLGA